MGIATIAAVSAMSQALRGRFATVAHALQGDKQPARKAKIDDSIFKKKDLGNFFDGVESKEGGRDETN
jgi:hypothetical protein